jgi:PhzF family phenazine biosynthesis protein
MSPDASSTPRNMDADDATQHAPRLRPFTQLDVFTSLATLGNGLAVVHEAEGLSEAQMAAFARWTNLSETTFLLPPTHPQADYRVRIFTPGGELPFAGHPTLGSCHAWLQAGGLPQHEEVVVQECGIGLVTVRRNGQRLAFAAPPLQRSGPLSAALLRRIGSALGLKRAELIAHQWCDNGPGWCAVMLSSAQAVLALKPDMAKLGDLKLGVVGAHPPGSQAQFEVRAFIPALSVPEDPVTGSLNAALAQWLIGAGIAPPHYVAAQGTALGRAGRVFIDSSEEAIWVGGQVAPCISGTVLL